MEGPSQNRDPRKQKLKEVEESDHPEQPADLVNEEPADMADDEPVKTIDSLPNNVVQHILSYLDNTQEAVRTSVLSRRWEHLWTSIPNLRFQEFTHTKRRMFLNLVSRCLHLRESLKIKEFHLRCKVLRDAALISSWVADAVKCRVEDLQLDLFLIKEPVELPACVFTCETLTSLVLRMGGILLKLPSSMQLNNLKILRLCELVLPCDHLTQQLIDRSLVLEELTMDSCDFSALRNKELTISSPRLIKLKIHEASLGDWSDCKVVISSKNLRIFDYVGYLSNDYFLDDLSMLTEARLFITLMEHSYDFEREATAHRAYMLLKGIFNVKYLILSELAVEPMAIAGDESWEKPVFNNLVYLGLSGGTNYLDGLEYWLMLESCPSLTTLAFLSYVDSTTDEEEEWVVDPVPSCFLTSMKCIEFRHYVGELTEEIALRVLLKHALVLEKLVVCCDIAANPEEVHEDVSKLPVASRNCQLAFFGHGLPRFGSPEPFEFVGRE